MNGKIVAVLFDAVGTLLYANPPVADVYQAAASRYGSRLTSNQIRDRVRTAIATSDAVLNKLARSATSESLERDRWQRIVAEIIDDVPPSATDHLFAELWQHFAQPRSWRLFDDVAPVWRELRARGYELGIASNFDSRLRTVLAGLPPLNDCQQLFVSSEIGYPKPDPRFFQAVHPKLSLHPPQILLIGDDWTNDILGGQAAGWSTSWIVRKKHDESSVYISNLAELLNQLPPRG